MAACSGQTSTEHEQSAREALIFDGGGVCYLPADSQAEYSLLPSGWQANPSPCTSGTADNCNYDSYCASTDAGVPVMP